MAEPSVYLEKLSAFSRMLRLEGLNVSPKETEDAAKILTVLGMDDRARLNTPGTVGSPNWEWCLENFEALKRKKNWVRTVVQESNR